MTASIPAHAVPLVPKWNENLNRFKSLAELQFNKKGIAEEGNIKIEATSRGVTK